MVTSCIRHCLQDCALPVGVLLQQCSCNSLCHSLSSAAALRHVAQVWLQLHSSCKLSCRNTRIKTFGGSAAQDTSPISLLSCVCTAAAGEPAGCAWPGADIVKQTNSEEVYTHTHHNSPQRADIWFRTTALQPAHCSCPSAGAGAVTTLLPGAVKGKITQNTEEFA